MPGVNVAGRSVEVENLFVRLASLATSPCEPSHKFNINATIGPIDFKAFRSPLYLATSLYCGLEAVQVVGYQKFIRCRRPRAAGIY